MAQHRRGLGGGGLTSVGAGCKLFIVNDSPLLGWMIDRGAGLLVQSRPLFDRLALVCAFAVEAIV